MAHKLFTSILTLFLYSHCILLDQLPTVCLRDTPSLSKYFLSSISSLFSFWIFFTEPNPSCVCSVFYDTLLFQMLLTPAGETMCWRISCEMGIRSFCTAVKELSRGPQSHCFTTILLLWCKFKKVNCQYYSETASATRAKLSLQGMLYCSRMKNKSLSIAWKSKTFH